MWLGGYVGTGGKYRHLNDLLHMNLKKVEMCDGVTDPRMLPSFSFSFSFFFSAQWDAINEMDEYFSPIHTYQVCNVLSGADCFIRINYQKTISLWSQ